MEKIPITHSVARDDSVHASNGGCHVWDEDASEMWQMGWGGWFGSPKVQQQAGGHIISWYNPVRSKMIFW